MAQEEEDDYSLEGKFSAAVKVVQSLPVEGSFLPSDDMMLMFYSYYKQATAGPCNFPRPIGFWDSNSKAKWDAWSSLGNMTKEEAMKNYIEAIQLILETVPISDEVSELVQKLGNFYTEVDGDDVEENAVDSRPFTRPFADHQDWNPDSRLLTVDDRGWRSDAKGSGSSVAPSMSSFTNGTHSSLNSEVEEEELICSIEPCAHYDPYMQFNGCLSGHMGVASDRNHRSTDSDNEEFCDSMEHLAMEERLPSSRGQSPGSGAATVRPNDLWFESNTTLKGADDEVLIVFTPSKHSNSLSRRENTSLSPKPLCKSRDAACGCELHPVRASRENVNEQIAVALLRLQRDMASALHRLHTLEELARSQVKEQTKLLMG
ncbi:Acyl-CoA-binding domain-containing protein 5 [Oryzias melastigma]|uniref:Acyl-CoA-binding domain-containing protein 5 n=1 Tax=Oryzias melastigma TaxID=30732 RepID=A0A834F4C3_ORYME|nr:Acyl-CoA-binding domain-containing protein 5 [Oryzias melastigma]